MCGARLHKQQHQQTRPIYWVPRYHEYIYRFEHKFDFLPYVDNQIDTILGPLGIHELFEGNPGNDITADEIVGNHWSHTDS